MTTGVMQAAIKPNFEVISRIAPTFSRWCVWFPEDRGSGKKPGKVPSNGRARIDTTKPDAWPSYESVKALYDGQQYQGLGVLLTGGAKPLVGFDIDHCLDGDGNVIAHHEAVAALEAMDSYVERSPSGDGLRGFAYGVKLDDCREKGLGELKDLEVYDGDTNGRYLTITGVPWRGEFRPIRANQLAIEEYLIRFGFVRDSRGGCANEASAGGGSDWPAVSDAEILCLLKQNNKRGRISKLLAGNISEHGGDSEARAALIGHVAYYTRDVEQIDRVMRSSGLMKPKLDELRSGQTLSRWEIRKLLADIDKTGGGSYWVDKAERSAGNAIEKAAHKGLQEKAREFLVGGLGGIVGSRGKILGSVFAYAELLYRDKRVQGAIWFDVFALMPIKTPAFGVITGDGVSSGEVLTDKDYRRTEDWLAREWRVALRPGEIRRVMWAWADRTPMNPITDRLDEFAAKWDGEPRLGVLLTRYFGAATGDDKRLAQYVSEVGIRMMVSVIARAYVPGSKVDTMLVLESPQGGRKSSGVRELAESISHRAFLEGFSLERLDKDAKLALRGRLLGECAELDGMSKHDANSLKNFLSARLDHYRDVYGLATSDWPRTIVLIGTTNETSYLRDATGNRRYWPVRVGRVDVETIRRDASMLWGEAVLLYRAGKRWWIDEESDDDTGLRSTQQREAMKRMQPDTWMEVLEDFNDRLVMGKVKHPKYPDTVADPVASFRLSDLMAMALDDGITGPRTVQEEIRFRTALVRAGWKHNGSEKHGKWALSTEGRNEAQERTR